MKVDPLSLQVFANLFSSVAEEMGTVLQRSSYSPNIKMRRDYSCAVFDLDGRMLAQAAHMPVHLGAMPMAMQAVLGRFDLGPGDVAMLNDPFAGGTHLPDVSLVSAAFSPAGARLGYVMCRAHHADIGGMTPGSMPASTSIFQEGLIIPPLLLVERGKTNEALLDLLIRNVRTPEERRGDLRAQLAAQRVGEERLVELADRYGVSACRVHGRALQSYAERTMRLLIRKIPPGKYTWTDWLDGDGQTDDPVRIQVSVRRDSGEDCLEVDFSGSAKQCRGSVNTVLAVTTAATLYVLRCLHTADSPVNAGSLVPLSIIAPPGLVVSARPPAAVAAGNVETSQRIVDVLFGALAQALPERCPAASQGTMNNLALGGFDPQRQSTFAYYETMGGGAGGRPGKSGMSAVHDHMSNTLNTPIEALESAYPLRVTCYRIRRGTGGKGLFRGGDGLQRDLQFLAESDVTILSERRSLHPYGIQGGEPGQCGENILIHQGHRRSLPPKVQLHVSPGDTVSVRTPGGGGFGQLSPGPTPC
ncbi:MAG TPA: hydantoinase B/oxoprolinase family protein [Chloroflexota bacterium]